MMFESMEKKTTALIPSVGADGGQSFQKCIDQSIPENACRNNCQIVNSQNNFPADIMQNGRFCCWRYEERDGRKTKVPYNPLTGQMARSNDVSSFTEFKTAQGARGYDGIGIGIFNGICAIDLDDCVTDSGYYSGAASEIVSLMHSYTEYSPSGNGLHILFRADSFQYDTKHYYIMNHKAGIEVYVAGSTKKYVTLTGNVCESYEFGDRTKELQILLDRFMRRPETDAGNAINAVNSDLDEVELSYNNQDIVPERAHLNVHFKKPTGSYDEMFQQMKEDGTISTRGLKDGAFLYGELVFDVNTAYFHNHGGYEFAKQFYTDAYKAAIEIVGGEQYILSAVMHADERNRAMSDALGKDVYHYHLHVVYIPVVEKQILWTKRCKDKSLVGTVKETIHQVSMSKKWNSEPVLNDMGEPLLTAKGKPVLRKSYSVLQDDFFNAMREAGYDDVERGERGSSEEHLTVTQFKVEKEQVRLVDLQEHNAEMLDMAAQLVSEKETAEKEAKLAQAKLDKVAPMLKNMEKLAAEFPDDTDKALPPADVLESAKSYREKKAMPLFKKIVKVLRSVYRSYLELKSRFARLEKDYDREVSKNSTLSSRVQQLVNENKQLQAEVRDYNRVKTAYGPERIAETVQAVIRQEQAQ